MAMAMAWQQTSATMQAGVRDRYGAPEALELTEVERPR